MLNLASLLEQSAICNPNKIALIMDRHRLRYAELNDLANKVAHTLVNLGVQPGDKVALMAPNTLHFVICYYGILKAGAVVVPLNVFFKQSEIAYHLEDSDSVVFFAWEGFLSEAAPGFFKVETCRHLIMIQAPESTQQIPHEALSFNQLLTKHSATFDTAQTMPDDTAVILYTSGTTGRPKGAELTHFNMFFNAMVCATQVIIVEPQDIVFACLPLFHAFGQTCTMNVCLYAGVTMTLMPRFEPTKALEIIERDQVTLFAGVPTMYFYLLNHSEAEKYDLSSLRRCVSGGATMPLEVMSAFNAKYGVTILEGYGLSETSPVAAFNRIGHNPKPGSIGTPIWGIEMRIVDLEDQPVAIGELGEIVIRGHNVMKGYYKRQEATAEAIYGGWFHTGDLARVDEDGYFFIVDRIKDMIIRGGFNVYSREVEEVLHGHPAIADVAVIGVPDMVMGEEIKAVVTLKSGQSATEQEIIDYCAERLAAYKYPRSVEFREVLPKTAAGKILKRVLKEQERSVSG